jgi:hypothetical protein
LTVSISASVMQNFVTLQTFSLDLTAQAVFQ